MSQYGHGAGYTQGQIGSFGQGSSRGNENYPRMQGGYDRSSGGQADRFEPGTTGLRSGSRTGSIYQQQQGQQGGRSRGPFFGKGPVGYTRADERLREEICDRLTDDDDLDASSIEVTVKNGEVTLSGTVQDRADKRRAEDCCEDVRGVKDVQNQIRVKADGSTEGAGSTGSTGSTFGSTSKRNTPQS
jgi:hypothetical protein